MVISTEKLTEIPLLSKIPFTFHSPIPSSLRRFRFYSTPSLIKTFSPLHTTAGNSNNIRNRYPWDDEEPQKNPTENPNASFPPKSKSSSASWLNKWTPSTPNASPSSPQNSTRAAGGAEIQYFDAKSETGPTPTTAIERIVLRLRNLGHGADNEEDKNEGKREKAVAMLPITGEEKLADLLRREWVRPDKMLVDEEKVEEIFPWERVVCIEQERGAVGEVKKRLTKVPTLAELTIEDTELRRLRRLGITLRERVSVPKAGVTGAVLEQIHAQWRNFELVRLKFHESLAHDMKTAHEIVERRSGGLVIWKSGSVMVVFRGSNYEGPSQIQKSKDREDDSHFVPDASNAENSPQNISNGSSSTGKKIEMPTLVRSARVMEDETEYNSLLDGLGPRFEDWWGTGVLPVDADLLPQTIPGFKTPFRFLPTGMRSRLTNAELTNLRKRAKSLLCHFALGRNRNHQGLAAAIIKLWEKSLIVKIAVKRGVQNTNNKLMAEEIKNLTGGVLLLRNKYFIVIYRGKDFLPPGVAAALVEREEMTKQIQAVEEKVRNETLESSLMVEGGQARAGTLAEFYESQARWGREISNEEREKMIDTASRIERARAVKRMGHKLSINLTGGVLLLRNKYFIVIYRGKDFLPPSVAAALVEREEMTKQIQDVEEKARNETLESSLMVEGGQARAGTLAEFYESQARWGREISNEEREKMIDTASRIERARAVKRMGHKLSIAQSKLRRAEKLLAELEASMVPAGPDDDQETITEEERSMFRRVGLIMKPYLSVGIRGVFDGVIENMHLHWKHRELVKLISKQKSLAFVEDTARLLEYESGGILVAIERVPKGHALIYYRGKNYRRPLSLRPRNLLTKAKALKRSVAMQRHKTLSQHISEVEKAIEKMRNEIDDDKDVQDDDQDIFDDIANFSQSEDEASLIGSDADEDILDMKDAFMKGTI